MDNSLKQPDLLLAIPHPPHQTHIMKATHCFTATTTVTPHRRNMLALTMCHHLFLQLQRTHAAKMHQPNQQPLLPPPTYDASTAAATDAHSDCIVKLPRPVSHSKLSRPHPTLSEHAFMSKDANLCGPPQPGLLQHQPTTDQQRSISNGWLQPSQESPGCIVPDAQVHVALHPQPLAGLPRSLNDTHQLS